MSAQSEGQTPEGEAPQAQDTADSYLAGIGASGAVLAAAAVGFVLMVGIVSFNVWPASTPPKDSSLPVELGGPTDSTVGSS